MTQFRFGEKVRVRPNGLGREHGRRCSGKAGLIVDTILRGTELRLEDLEWVFVRFDDPRTKTTLFFDWLNREDLRPA